MHHNEAMMKEFEEQQKESEGWRAAQRKMISPLKSEYEGHLGSVHGLDSSPFHRNIFASCGSDGSIHLCSMLHTKVQMFFEPVRKNLTCIRWSPFRPLVFATASGDGRLFIYDLQDGQMHPTLSLDVCKDDIPINSIAFNPRQSEYMAVTGEENTVRIFELVQRFSNDTNMDRETRLLQRLLTVKQEDTNLN